MNYQELDTEQNNPQQGYSQTIEKLFLSGAAGVAYEEMQEIEEAYLWSEEKHYHELINTLKRYYRILSGKSPAAQNGITLQSKRLYQENTEFFKEYAALKPEEVNHLLHLGSISDNWKKINNKLHKQQPLRIVFLNDIGFAGGAGIALRRQVLSFLNAGHKVGLVANIHTAVEMTLDDQLLQHEGWLDTIRMNLHLAAVKSDTIRNLLEWSIVLSVLRLKPDLVITGNFHVSSWSGTIIDKLSECGLPLVAYSHDPDWVTGSCIYPQYYACEEYKTSCQNNFCPMKTAQNLADKRVFHIQKEREICFNRNQIPFAVNSIWLKEIFAEKYQYAYAAELLPLAVDTTVFKAYNKDLLKKKYGIVKDFIVLIGSENSSRLGKGIEYSIEVINRLNDNSAIQFITFGYLNSKLKGENIIHFGYVSDNKKLAEIYSLADVFLNPVTVEAFGQTTLEAAACETAIICFPVCGVVDIARDGINALHAPAGDLEGLIQRVELLQKDPKLRDRLAKSGRKIVEEEFSLETQHTNWYRYLSDLSENRSKGFYPARRVLTTLNARFSDCYLEPAQSAINNRKKRLQEPAIKTKPSVAVITVTLNCADVLEKTLFSIFSQKGINLEIIVVDGGSNDGTIAILEEYNSLIDIWRSENDNGIYNAMNKAAALAKSEYCIFINAGDYFVNSYAISDAFSSIENDTDVLYGNVFYIPEDGKPIIIRADNINNKWEEMLAGDFTKRRPGWLSGQPPHQGLFMKTELVCKLKFAEEYRVSADFDLILRAYEYGAKFQQSAAIIAVYPGGGMSAQNAHIWISDVWKSVKQFTKNPEAADEYFAPIYESYKSKIMQADNREKPCLKENFWYKLSQKPRLNPIYKFVFSIKCYLDLQKSGLFWGAYYSRNYPGLGKWLLFPLWHYILKGEKEGKRPNKYFIPRWYRSKYPENCINQDMNALWYYYKFGWLNGCNPGPDFNTEEYIKNGLLKSNDIICPLVLYFAIKRRDHA